MHELRPEPMVFLEEFAAVPPEEQIERKSCVGFEAQGGRTALELVNIDHAVLHKLS